MCGLSPFYANEEHFFKEMEAGWSYLGTSVFLTPPSPPSTSTDLFLIVKPSFGSAHCHSSEGKQEQGNFALKPSTYQRVLALPYP